MANFNAQKSISGSTFSSSQALKEIQRGSQKAITGSTFSSAQAFKEIQRTGQNAIARSSSTPTNPRPNAGWLYPRGIR